MGSMVAQLVCPLVECPSLSGGALRDASTGDCAMLGGCRHSVGCTLPSSMQATRAYLHKEDDVEAALAKAGFKVTKREMTATSFYFSRLLSAQRVQ